MKKSKIKKTMLKLENQTQELTQTRQFECVCSLYDVTVNL